MARAGPSPLTPTKSFFSYLRSKSKVNNTVTSLNKGDGTKTEGPLDTASVLADFFNSVFIEEPYGPLPETCYNKRNELGPIEAMHISDSDVKAELQKLDIYKTWGPDQVYPKLLVSLSEDDAFVGALSNLFRTCSNTCRIPKAWKEANVVALHKKGPKDEAGNYRPVSLTSVVCKVYEKFVRRHIFDHVEKSVSAHQHGFVGGRSCLSNLLETVEVILDLLAEGAPVDILYFDFQKAFDTVPHWRLLTKLEGYGITGDTLEIIRDFLSGRTMKVCVGSESSDNKRVASGVPQGSVLGPLLFVLFVNDLPDNIKSHVKLFADDLKLVSNVSNYDDVVKDLALLEEWENIWLLRFNADKCKILHIDKNDNPNREYVLDGTVLKSIESECDLGLHTTSQFNWNVNIKNAIAKANRMISWVARNMISRDRDVMLLVYKSLIRPHIEYCVQIWSPMPRHGNWATILELEKVQRKFTRLVEGIGLLPYGERLAKLGLTTLAERRIRGDLIETYKITSGSVNYCSTLFRKSRSGLNLLRRDTSRSDKLRSDYLSERVIDYWNKLPAYVKLSENVNTFKGNLCKYKKQYHNKSGNFWEVSGEVLNRIETPSYVQGRESFTTFVKENKWYAKKMHINIHYNIFLM